MKRGHETIEDFEAFLPRPDSNRRQGLLNRGVSDVSGNA